VSDVRTLLADIETSPNLVHSFDLRNAFISIDQIVEPSRMICFAAKWLGEPKVTFRSEFHHDRKVMHQTIHELLDEADVLMHFNGKRFDEPKIRGELYLAGFNPPAPFQRIDLWETVRGFGLPSSKLDYILKASELPSKVQTGGFRLWRDCLAGDPKAWALMKRYNIQDVRAMEPLYERLRPWIAKHPSHAQDGAWACPSCGSGSLQRRGYATTTQGSRYRRYQCQDCGAWSQDTRRESGPEIKQAAA